MAQWIRRWFTKPETLGSIPSEVVFLSPNPYGCVMPAFSVAQPLWLCDSSLLGCPSGCVIPYGCVIPAYLAVLLAV